MKRALSITICILLCISIFCGCGASYDMDKPAENVTAPAAEPFMPEKSEDASWEEMDYGYLPEPNEPGSATGSDISSGSSVPNNAKLIYTAWLELETTAFDTAVSGLEALVKDMGGYFENSRLNNYGTYRSGSYTVRVPAEKFEAFCGEVGQLCQLISVERSAEDISEAYYDTESRLVTQRTKLERLQELLAQAVNMEDIITLESAISETELNIEMLTGTLRKYDSLVGFSTVEISLQEVYELSEVEEPVIGFGAKLAEAFKRGSRNFVDSVQSFALGFARNWVGWLIFIAIVAAVLVPVLRLRKKIRLRRHPVDSSEEAPKGSERK